MSYDEVLILKELVGRINKERSENCGRYSFAFHEFTPGHYNVHIYTGHCVYPSEIMRISSTAEELHLVWFISAYSSTTSFILQ